MGDSMDFNKNKVVLSFHDIRYVVRQKLGDSPFSFKTTKKEILDGISGIFPPGLNVIMGATGSGKTSLLDVLAQRKDPHGLKNGFVLMNGEELPLNFRLMSGYVVQNDIVMGSLTVRENLMFSAKLRLPGTKYSQKQLSEKVDQVIEELGLQSCANTQVGNELMRGVSGGEKKRVNIAMEMILDPPVLFLDEPTTGLDSNTATVIARLLHKLASDGRNVIISIHQPRYSIFTLFDRLILLHKGKIVYRGHAREAVDYFNNLGFVCPTFHNPADFFLDVIGDEVNTSQLIDRRGTFSEAEATHAEKRNSKMKRMSGYEEIIEMKEDIICDNVVLLLDEIENAPMTLKENRELQVVTQNYESKSGSHPDKSSSTAKIEYANGFSKQLKETVKRTVLCHVRAPEQMAFQIIAVIFFGLMIGLLYFQTDTSFKSGMQNRAGCFFFLTTAQMFSNLAALNVFITNRAHFVHESASGYYRVSVFFIAQVFADLIPNRLIPSIFFSFIIYFMIGLQAEAAKFVIFALTNFIVAICASSLAFWISASFESFVVAYLALSMPYILMMLFGGFLVNVDSLLPWLKWVKYLSIFRYGLNAFTVNEMSGLVFIDNSSYPGFELNSSTPCISTVTHFPIPNCTTGEVFMELQDIEYGVWGLWKNVLALSIITLLYMLLTYVKLRRMSKFK